MKQQYNIHIGRMIKSVFDESGMTVADFARRIHCERTNVYKIFSRSSIDVDLLVRISVVLQHNFLADVMNLYGLETDIPTQLQIYLSINDMSVEDMNKLSHCLTSLKHPKKP
ncbi:MAG: helix-turn-helix transcriptional regulator [Bacteroidales bacterium]|nr:helix-turn-helix transcriptional regulator [Bacteroidales bacterium]